MYIQPASPRIHKTSMAVSPYAVRHNNAQIAKVSLSAPLRREGGDTLFSTASRVKLIHGFSGSTKANDRIHPLLRQPKQFS